MTSRAVALAISVATIAVAGQARAAEPEATRPVRFSLTLRDASPLDACGGAPALIDAVHQRLHRAALGPASEADIALGVEVDTGWRAHIVEHDRAGAALGGRDVPLSPGDCPKSLDTLAVVLAIMIGPERAVAIAESAAVAASPTPGPGKEEKAPEPRHEGKPALPPPAKPALPRAPLPSPVVRFDEPPLRWRLSPVAELAGGTGVLPHLAFGIQGGVVVRPPIQSVFFIVRGSYWPSRSTDTAAVAEVDRAGGALLTCAALLRALPTSLAACGGIDGGRLHSTSSVLTRASESALLLDVFAEGRLGYRVAASENLLIEPVVAAQVAAVLRRDRFTYRDRTGQELILLQPAPAAFQATFGVAVHFL